MNSQISTLRCISALRLLLLLPLLSLLAHATRPPFPGEVQNRDPNAYWAAPIYGGIARVIDGNTLELTDEYDGSKRLVVLSYIDAPELNQFCRRGGQLYACGREAARRLSEVAEGQLVGCGPALVRNSYLINSCSVEDKNKGTEIDLSVYMVSQGWALALWHAGERGGVLAFYEIEAARAGRGIHAGTFQTPQQFRESLTRNK